ncbi:phosphoglycerate kinase [Candidatus Pacearchaeota archaeon]|nr:phosphoglycerate kinase [Candidatus Pacearchaeota archaeon]
MEFKTINDFELKGKRILVRIDLNSSVVNGKVLESARFLRHAHAIKSVLKKNPAKIVLLAHQGRKGEKDFTDLRQHARILNKYVKVKFTPILPGKEALRKIENLHDKIFLLDNVRFLDDETNIAKNDNVIVDFAKGFDIFIQDAFSVCHRAHATTVLIPRIIKSCIGPNVDEELKNINQLVNRRPLLLLIGGQKVADYLPIVKLLEKDKRNKLLASGYLDFLIRISQGFDYGMQNQIMKDIKFISEFKNLYNKFSGQIVLPIDYAIEKDGKRKEVLLSNFPSDFKICDIGKKTIELFSKEIGKANAVFVKGALGCVEDKRFAEGTVSILKAVAKSRKFSFISGGSISTAIKRYKIKGKFSYISLSGGALIAYLGGKELPGLEALR